MYYIEHIDKQTYDLSEVKLHFGHTVTTSEFNTDVV